MIRLTDLLKEMAMSNPLAGTSVEQSKSEISKVIQAAQQMGEQNPVLWRGSSGLKSAGLKTTYLPQIMYVTGDRQAFRGSSDNTNKLISKVFQKDNPQPVFAYGGVGRTALFGSPGVVVFEQSFTIYQSDTIKDVMVFSTGATPEQLEKGAKTYKQKDLSSIDPKTEVVVDATNYWLLFNMRGVQTYKQVVERLKKMIA
jgi:hypothetical protein